jgi:hypothetical protein
MEASLSNAPFFQGEPMWIVEERNSQIEKKFGQLPLWNG